MGGQSSRPKESQRKECRCFCIKSPLRNKSRKDPFTVEGSIYRNPLARSRKGPIEADWQRHQIYAGLEEEPSSQRFSMEVQVYEGEDAKQKLEEDYTLLEVIGVGSTSSVHKCVQKGSSNPKACKIIDKTLVQEKTHGRLDEYRAEIEVLRDLQHPNIIRLFDVFIDSKKIYIIMELMEGGELFDYVVHKGSLNEEEASRIVRKVTSALLYMHSHNIVHKDLKPQNLMLSRKPRPGEEIDVKIIDFGLCKTVEDDSYLQPFLESGGYLAPEILQRRGYTASVDTWALGVIVFVLLCGSLPFGDDVKSLRSTDFTEAKFALRFPRWAKNISGSAKNLLSHLLDVNPYTRYTTQQAYRHPWVQGETASRDNALMSPTRIVKQSRIQHTDDHAVNMISSLATSLPNGSAMNYYTAASILESYSGESEADDTLYKNVENVVSTPLKRPTHVRMTSV